MLEARRYLSGLSAQLQGLWVPKIHATLGR